MLLLLLILLLLPLLSFYFLLCYRRSMGGGQRISSEDSATGDVGVLSTGSGAVPDHLVVMVHGILGSTADWEFGANQFAKMLPDKVIVHCSECNMYKLSLDGVDVMGERLSEEVIEVIKSKPELRKISFIAHSVGGLVARYTIGKLYRFPRKCQGDCLDSTSDGNSVGTLYGLEPINFITVATPHLGSRGNKQVPFLFGVPAIEKFASLIIHWIFGRTGRHLFLTDTDGEQPLLLRMTTDCGHLYFMSALRSFKRRVAYANVGYDHIVGWRTSSIRRNCELPKWQGSSNGKYPHIVYEEFSNEKDADKCAHVSTINCDCDVVEEEIIKGLAQVSWERVDVSFHNSKLRFAAHSVIQVKAISMHSEGADVIQHIFDNFRH